MDNAAWQLVEAVAELEADFSIKLRRLLGLQLFMQLGHGLTPPVRATWIGALQWVALPGKVKLCQCCAHGRAMGDFGVFKRTSAQTLHERGGFGAQFIKIAAVTIGQRMGSGYVVLGKMRHEVEEKRQFIGAKLLKQGQHVAAVRGGDKVVGVFDACADADVIEQFACSKII